ncbi:MAG: NUDIX domain-containing protein [archaeon]
MENLPEVYGVKGLYFDRNKGIFLFESEKSKAVGKLTLPGGNIARGETHLDGLKRKVLEEIGFAPVILHETPFHHHEYVKNQHIHKNWAYLIDFENNPFGNDSHGHTPLGAPFYFIPLKDILRAKSGVTCTTWHILNSRKLL